jgi:hypothetical protein
MMSFAGALCDVMRRMRRRKNIGNCVVYVLLPGSRTIACVKLCLVVPDIY